MYKAQINVSLRPSILDPQGKAVHHALEQLGMAQVSSVRIGKFVEMWIEEDSEEAALRSAEEACGKLLANPVMENYSISLERSVN